MKADYKNIKAEYEAITRDLSGFDKKTGSIYESVYIISRRANQIAAEIKDELTQKNQRVFVRHGYFGRSVRESRTDKFSKILRTNT